MRSPIGDKKIGLVRSEVLIGAQSPDGRTAAQGEGRGGTWGSSAAGEGAKLLAAPLLAEAQPPRRVLGGALRRRLHVSAMDLRQLGGKGASGRTSRAVCGGT